MRAAPPCRIVSLAPCLTEIVHHLGAGERMVGRSDYCDAPAAVLSLPSVGGYYDPRLEDLLLLQPDLVLAHSRQTWLLERCRQLEIPAAGLSFSTLEEIVGCLEQVGVLLGLEDEGVRAAALLREEIERATVVRDPPRRVLWVHYHDPGSLRGMVGLGPGGHTHELLLRAGAHNVLEGYAAEAPSLSQEMVLTLAPDVIVDDARFLAGRPDFEAEAHAPWQALLAQPRLSATRLRLLRNDLPYRPGPRIGQALAELAALIDGA